MLPKLGPGEFYDLVMEGPTYWERPERKDDPVIWVISIKNLKPIGFDTAIGIASSLDSAKQLTLSEAQTSWFESYITRPPSWEEVEIKWEGDWKRSTGYSNVDNTVYLIERRVLDDLWLTSGAE